jgi:hypothetical protein
MPMSKSDILISKRVPELQTGAAWLSEDYSRSPDADQNKNVMMVGRPPIALRALKLESPVRKVPPPYMASPPLQTYTI